MAICPAIYIIGIYLEDVTHWLAGVVSLYSWFLALAYLILLNHRSAAAHALLNEDILVIAREKPKLYTCFLKHCVPGEARDRVVVSRIHAMLLSMGG